MLKYFMLLALICLNSLSAEPEGLNLGNGRKQMSRNVIEPVQAGADSRFRSITYVENAVFKIKALYDYPTYIEFEKDEVVSTMVKAKEGAWQFTIAANKLFLKPITANADMPMTVMTNKRIYFFELEAKEPATDYDEVFAFYTKFRYPNDTQAKSIKTYVKSVLPDLNKPELFNFNYTVTGEETIFPLKVFDDGNFTYFEFKERGGVIPAIFIVDNTDAEALVNFRILADYVVVEAVSARFTLRYGKDIVCVFNETLWQKKKK